MTGGSFSALTSCPTARKFLPAGRGAWAVRNQSFAEQAWFTSRCGSAPLGYAGPAVTAQAARPGMQEHLGVAVGALVELVIRVRCRVQGQLAGDDLRWTGLPADDEVAQLAVVPLDRALSRSRCRCLSRTPARSPPPESAGRICLDTPPGNLRAVARWPVAVVGRPESAGKLATGSKIT